MRYHHDTITDTEDRFLAGAALNRAISKAVDRVSIGGLSDDEVEVLAFIGHPAAVRVTAWQVLAKRGQDWTAAADGPECQSCHNAPLPGGTRCAACEAEIDEAAQLTANGMSMAAVVDRQNARHEVSA